MQSVEPHVTDDPGFMKRASSYLQTIIRPAAVVLLIVFSVVWLLRGEGSGPRLPSGEDASMASRVEAQLNSGEPFLDFAALAPFPWDRMYIFPSYVTEGEVAAALGKRWSKLDDAAGDADDRYLIVFEREGEPRVWYRQPILLDLDRLATGKPIDRVYSRFKIGRFGGHWRLQPVTASAS